MNKGSRRKKNLRALLKRTGCLKKSLIKNHGFCFCWKGTIQYEHGQLQLNEPKTLNVFFVPWLFKESKTLHVFIVPWLLKEPKNLHVFVIVPWLPSPNIHLYRWVFSTGSCVSYLKFFRISGSGTICYIQTNMLLVTKLPFSSTTTWKR